jgi:protocadherin Fat 1/2/3
MTYTFSQNGDTKTSTISFIISAVNDAPVINANSTINYSENDNTPIDISVNDVDNDELTITITGLDNDNFNFVSETVLLNFKNTPDYETKNKYQITITATDGQIEVSKDITINILDINENPQGYKVPSSIDVIETKE